MYKYHVVLEKMSAAKALEGWTTSIINLDGTLSSGNLTFPNNEILYEELPKYKIIVCFPQCDTNPFRGGNVETLTQRYWEAMLSGCLMIGRASQELIDLLGYNPVINVDWDKPEEQLQTILKNINEYQNLADRNLLSARSNASWDSRIETIKDVLTENGYTT